jgi:hypothetical protein
MLRRLPGLCLGALLVATVAVGLGRAKPPDLPDNPPIIVAEGYAPADPQVPIPYGSTRPENGGLYTFGPFNPNPHPQVSQALTTPILYTVHPISSFFPAQQPVPVVCPCGGQSCQPGQPCQLRTVIENLQALEQAAALLAQAKQLVAEGRATEALECLDQVRALVPGSPCARHADEVACEVGRHAAFADAFRTAFEEAVRDYWGPRGVFPATGLCWMSQLEQLVAAANKSAKGSEECCEEAGCPKQCEKCESACPRCEKMHAQHVKIKKQMSKAAESKALVDGLMKACYEAIEEQQFGKATDLARAAHALDAKRVDGDPLVYKFGLLAEKPKCNGGQEECSEPKAPCCPNCPCKPSNNYPAQGGVQSNLSSGRQIFIIGSDRTVQNVFTTQGAVKYPTEVLECPVKVKVQQASTGSLMFGQGVNSDSGLTGSVVLNERNCNVVKCANCTKCSASSCCPLCRLSCCGVKLADACELASCVLKEMYCSPAVPNDAGNNCLTLGLSSAGQVNAFCRTRHEGVVYHLLYRDGIFLMWMTPEAKK